MNSNPKKFNKLRSQERIVGGVNKADLKDERLIVYLQDALEEINAGEVYNYE